MRIYKQGNSVMQIIKVNSTMQGVYNQTKLFMAAFLLVASTMAVTTFDAQAHSEAEKARFVATTGQDQGLCNNRFRPCKTIAYAVRQANKGDKILLAGGSYVVTSPEELVYLVSDLQPVYGGYSAIDNYQSQAPDRFVTSISGVPLNYAQILHERGFSVIQDSKGIDQDPTSQMSSKLDAIMRMESVQAASNCVDGNAAGFACRNIALLGRVPLSALPTSSTGANDIWGHVDLNDMREYAIIGMQRGVAVVDVTDPESPSVVGSIDGQWTTWRDIKVMQYYDEQQQRFSAYAYSGADSVNEGLSIIDLNNLPNDISLVTQTLVDRASHNVYVSGVDYTTNTALAGQTPLLHVAGSPNFGGAWRTFTLTNPQSPAIAYRNLNASRADYTHDASSLLITDERVSSGCLLPNAQSCNVILDFNEQEVRLWQHNNSEQAAQLSSMVYPNLEYVHSGWWSENKQFIFVHDELDERNRGINTSVNIFDISDLREPQHVATWVGPTPAVDHNGFVKGNKYYMSNYERGVTILDIGNASAPREIGYFDTFGTSDNASFNGVWGVYPYLPSGIILASDIQGGLYILRDDTLLESDDAVGFANTQVQAQENTTLRIEVSKQGLGSQSVDYQILYPSSSEQDIGGVSSSSTLSWPANDNQSQFIEINVLADSFDEPNELFVVVLNNASGGDIVNDKSNLFVTIEGTRVTTGQISFAESQLSVLETQGALNISVNRVGGSTQALSVNYTLVGDSAELNVDFAQANGNNSGELTWPNGDSSSRSIELQITNDTLNEANEAFSLVLTTTDDNILGTNSSVNVVIRDDESNQAPVVNAGNDIQVNTRQTVVLNGASATDPDDNLSLQWTQVAGLAVTLSNPTSLSPSFVAPSSAGSVTLQLRATDDFGVSSTSRIVVTTVAPAVVTTPPPATSGGGGSMSFLIIGLAFIVAVYRQHGKQINRRRNHNM
jgi:choice-of-anchor B domain-containing protein